jgi:chromate transporter
MSATATPNVEHVPCGIPTLRQFILYFLKLGTFGFGGPVALAGYMRRDLVEERKWISEEEYVEGFALAQMAPGPLAAQLAIYLGWVRGGVAGATMVGIAFIIPSFVMCVALAVVYIRFGKLPLIQSLFYSIGAAVIGIIALSAYKLVRKTVGTDRMLWAIWSVSVIYTAWTETESLWIIIAGGIAAVIAKMEPKIPSRTAMVSFIPAWALTGMHGAGNAKDLWDIALFFTKAGAFVFGSGLAIVPFLHGGVVDQFMWLDEKQFIDAVAVAMITPGPVVITVAFIGYLVAGTVGATVAALGTFLPCYLFTVIPAPYYSKIAKRTNIKVFVGGVTAAAIGAVAGAVWVLGRHAVVDIPTAFIALLALLLIVRAKVPEPFVIFAAGIAGIAIKYVF